MGTGSFLIVSHIYSLLRADIDPEKFYLLIENKLTLYYDECYPNSPMIKVSVMISMAKSKWCSQLFQKDGIGFNHEEV